MRFVFILVVFLSLPLTLGCIKNVQGPSFTPTAEGQGWDFGSDLGPYSRTQSSPIKIGDRIFLALMEGKIYAFDAEKGKLIEPKSCSFIIPQGIRSTPAEKDGILYFGAFDKKLHGFDTNSCQEIFSFQTNGYISASPLIVDDFLFFGSYDGRFRAIDLSTRRLSWEYNCGKKIRGGAVATTNGIVFGNIDGVLFHLDRSKGSEIWKHEMNWEIYGAPAFDSEIVVIANREGKVIALRESDGSHIWEYQTPDNGYKYREEFWVTPVIYDNNIYVGSTWGNIYALKLIPDSGDAELLWEPFQTKNQINRGENIFSEVVINNNDLIFGCNDGKLYCLDRLTGTEKWTFQTLGEIRGQPLIDGERVIFPSNDHYLYAVSIVDGQPIRGT